MKKNKRPNEHLICTTVYLKGQPQQMLISGQVIAEANTEIDLFSKAKRLGIDFRTLKPQKSIGDKDHFSVNWFGSRSVAEYLEWKGTIGTGLLMRRIIKEHNNDNDPQK